jgi:hypothetical protein
LLLKWWRWFTGKFLAIESPFDSGVFLARVNGLERRKHTRIKLPSVTSPVYPRLFVKDITLPVVDLSVGGVCVQDTRDNLSTEVGHIVELTIAWPDQRETVKARVVAFSRHINRHLQFQDLSPGALTKISLMVRAGGAGQKLRPAPVLKNGPVQLHAVELWTGINGDSIVFHGDGAKVADLTFLNLSMSFYTDIGPRVSPVRNPGQSRPARPLEVADALIFLVNIPNPSPRIQRLIETLTKGSHKWLNTGSTP